MRKAALAAVLVLLLAATTASARFGMPDPLTPRGEAVEEIYVQIAVAATIVFLLVFALLVYILVRYREASGHGRATHEAERHNIKAEVIWTVVPLLVMAWVGYISYVGLIELDAGAGDPSDATMAVTVTGYQWAWEMDYGGDVKTLVTASPAANGSVTYSDTFHLPADTPILLRITGGDVIHAFNIQDANNAYFSMDDANPTGQHKFAEKVLAFPEGRYLVQCKEMCFNPGHAYMRAEIIVEPQEDFDAWLKERQLAVGADLTTSLTLTLDDDGFAQTSLADVAAGSRVITTLNNPTGQSVNVTFPDGTFVMVAGGATELAAFDLAAPGDYSIESSNGGELAITAIDAEPIEIVLGDYEIEPADLRLEAGTTYLLQVRNTHSTTHNFYLGHFDGDGAKEILAQSPNLGPGAAGSFVFTPTATGAFDTWCDVPGHYGLGMHADAHVA